MTSSTITLADDEMRLDEAIALAAAHRMYLISNGRRSVISPTIPPGWQRIAVRVKTPRLAQLEAEPC